MPVTTWTAGQVLAAQDLNDTFASKVDYALTANAQSGTGASAYTFVLADASRLTTATGASAKTFTIPPQANVAWVANSIIRVANYGAGDLTIAGGSGVTVTNASKTLAQFESAALVRTGSNAWTLIPFSGGAGNADFSDAADGTYTDGGVTWKWKRYTASGTLTITKAGFADVLVIGGGGGGAQEFGSGGGAGGVLEGTNVYLPAGSATVVVGSGGAGGIQLSSAYTTDGYPGGASMVYPFIAPGGGGGVAPRFNGTSYDARPGRPGGSGSGGSGVPTGSGGSRVGGAGLTLLGNAGGDGSVTADAGGGGGAGGAGGNAISGTGGAGGSGKASSITGSSVTRAGGGGGGGGTGGAAGSGGGGAGGGTSATGGSGTANTGGGGGGTRNAGFAAGNGGSGIVIVRVRTN